MKKKMIALTCSLIFANTIPVFAASDYGINIDQKYVSGDASQLSDAISESLNDMGVKKVSSYDLEKKRRFSNSCTSNFISRWRSHGGGLLLYKRQYLELLFYNEYPQ